MKHLGLAALVLLAAAPAAAQNDEPNPSQFKWITETGREPADGGGSKRTYEGVLDLSLRDRTVVSVRMKCTATDGLQSEGIAVSCERATGQPVVNLNMTCGGQTFTRGDDLRGPCGVSVTGALRQLGHFEVRGRTTNRSWTVFELDWSNVTLN